MRKKIMSPDSAPKHSCVWNEDFDYLCQILLAFRLEDYEVDNDK